MKYRFGSRLFYFVVFATLFSCSGGNQFESDAPYSLCLYKARTWREVTLARDAFVNDASVQGYIRLYDLGEQGNWYYLLWGAEESLQAMMKEKMVLEDEHGIKDLEIVNFNSLIDFELNTDEVPKVDLNVKAKEYFHPLKEKINSFPAMDGYMLDGLLYFGGCNSLCYDVVGSCKDTETDLPRGISQRKLIRNARYYIEAVYRNMVRDDKLTIGMASIDTATLGISLTLADYYSNLILESGDFDFEEKLPIKYGNWSGYEVNLVTKRGSHKSYTLVSDESTGIVYMIQGATRNRNQVEQFATRLGKEPTVLESPLLVNALSAMPAKCTSPPSYFRANTMRKLSGTWGMKLEGAEKAFWVVEDSAKRFITVETWMIPVAKNLDYIFADRYTPKRRKGYDSLQINEAPVWVKYKRNPKAKNKTLPYRVNVKGKNYIAIIESKRHAARDSTMLLQKVPCMNIFSGGTIYKEKGLWD